MAELSKESSLKTWPKFGNSIAAKLWYKQMSPIELSMKQSKKPIRSTLKNIRMFTNQVHRLPNLLNDLSMEVISYVNRTTIVYYHDRGARAIPNYSFLPFWLIALYMPSGESTAHCKMLYKLNARLCNTGIADACDFTWTLRM